LQENLSLMEKERDEIGRQQQANKSETTVLLEEEMALLHELNDFQFHRDTFEEYRDSATARLQTLDRATAFARGRNVLTDMFVIGYNGPFGSINSFRMGQLPSVHVEWNEINAGFGEAAQLTQMLAVMAGLEFREYVYWTLESVACLFGRFTLFYFTLD
jgi:beclin